MLIKNKITKIFIILPQNNGGSPVFPISLIWNENGSNLCGNSSNLKFVSNPTSDNLSFILPFCIPIYAGSSIIVAISTAIIENIINSLTLLPYFFKRSYTFY